mgnify:CR=1 FL=1
MTSSQPAGWTAAELAQAAARAAIEDEGYSLTCIPSRWSICAITGSLARKR